MAGQMPGGMSQGPYMPQQQFPMQYGAQMPMQQGQFQMQQQPQMMGWAGL
jgi:hypothetical protein